MTPQATVATLMFLHPVSFSWFLGLEPFWLLGLCEMEATLPYDVPAETMGQALQSQLEKFFVASSCSRADKCAKDWMSKNKSKNKKQNQQNQQNQKTTPTQNPARTSSNLSETVKLRFRTTNPPDHSVPLHKDVGIFRQLDLYQ